MIVLKEIANLLNEERLNRHDLSYDPWTASNKVGDYFRALLADSFDEEDDAAQHYYQTDRKSTSYQKLKSKLKRVLISRLLLLDFQQSETDDRRRAYMECHRAWAAVRILIGKNRRQAAIKISKQLLRQTLRYELTHLSVDILRLLRAHYGIQEGNLSTLEQYNTQFHEQMAILAAEDLAEEYYTDIISRYVYRKAPDDEVTERARELYQQLKPLLDRHDAYRLHVSARMIGLMIYTSRNDYPATVGFCQAGIDFFKDKKFQANLPLQLLYQQLVVCYTQMRQYPQASAAAEEGLMYLVEGSFNWFKHQEQRFMLCMHTERYEQAFALWHIVTEHRAFRKAPEQLQEMWLIYEAYLYYLATRGELGATAAFEENKFRMGRFLNQTPRYSQDKKGMNIPILIIQILFHIDNRQNSQVIDRIEAIEKYCSRYLTQGNMLRSNCFIKMLLQIPDANFHVAAVKRKTEKYWQN